MKSWTWRRLIVILVMIALPLTGYATTEMSIFTVGDHMLLQPAQQQMTSVAPAAAATVNAAGGIVKPADAHAGAACPLPCQMDQDDRCDMAHGAASCFLAIASTSSLVPPTGSSLTQALPDELDPPSNIPPLLERPPALTLLLS